MLLAAACLLFGFAAAEPQPAAAATPDQEMLTISSMPLPSNQDLQNALLDLINSERGRNGLKPLEWDEKLANAARDHAELMSQEGRLSHQFDGEPDLLHRLTGHDVRMDSASENVVYDVTPEGAHEAFMKSPLHRNNLLNPSYDGVGIAVVNLHGVIYVVEDFAHRIADMSDEAVSRRVATRFASLRQQYGLPPIEFVSDTRVAAMVEQMAMREMPDSHAPMNLPGARLAASYATINPDEIPAGVARLASMRSNGPCTVSVRFLRTPRYPSGLFWASIVMFADNPSFARK